MMEPVCVILCNVPDAETGQALARALVEKRLVACVNLLPGVQSVYRWQGQVEQGSETTMLIKTALARYDEVEKEIRAVHPYDLPEILCLPVQAGLPAYLEWVVRESGKELNA